MPEQSETYTDRPLRFFIPSRDARGRVVRLDKVLTEILSAHRYPPQVERTLAEALVLTALLGSSLKDADGQLTMQAQTEAGAISLLVCDYKDGALRGYAQFDTDRIAALPQDATLFALFGKGYLAITFDREKKTSNDKGRYQGIVPLEGNSLSDAAEHYFAQSEQLPTLIRVRIDSTDREASIAGGIVLQHLSEGEEGRERLHVRPGHPEWEHVVALAGSITGAELTDRDLPLEEIIWRLFHEEDEVRIEEGGGLKKGCRCDEGHIRDVISRFSASEREEMADSSGKIAVNCEFCSRSFPIGLNSLND
ncbi:MAG: Hsp33 family molecular chaperone HslO [Sphingorhabdus sp.]